MTLLIAAAAAVVTALIWYSSARARRYRIGTLSLMYWGAALMWLVDTVIAYLEQGAAVFTPEAAQMGNDAFLGLAVTVLGLVIWLVILLCSDPDGVVRSVISGKKAYGHKTD